MLFKKNNYWCLVVFIFTCLYISSCASAEPQLPFLGQKPPEFPNDKVVYLLDEVIIKVKQDKTYDKTVHQVIKIMHEDGKDWGDCSVGFNSRYEKISLDFARTVTPDGKVIYIEKNAMKTIEPYSDYPEYCGYKKLCFSLPAVTVGSIIDYQYTVGTRETVPYKEFLSSHRFQRYPPIMKSHFKVIAPRDFKLTCLIVNQKPEIDIEESINEKGSKKIYEWVAENIPRVKYETNMPLIDDIVPSLFVTSEESWDRLSKWYYKLREGKTRPDKQIIDEVNKITKDLKSQEQKIRAVYNYICKEVRFVSVRYGKSGYEPNPAPKVFRNKYGDCKDKATLLISMLSVIDVPAYYVSIPTNKRPKLLKKMPFLYQFDHCIVAIKKKDKYFFMDPQNYTRFGDLPRMDQDRDVLVFANDNYQFDHTDVHLSKDLRGTFIELEEDGGVILSRKSIYYGSYDIYYRSLLATCTKEDYETFKGYLISRYKDSVLLSYKCSDPFDLNSPISLEYSFRAKDYGQKLSDLWILPPFLSSENKEFEQKERLHPLLFDGIWIVEYHLEVEIPESYEVHFLPKTLECDNEFVHVVSTFVLSGSKILFDHFAHRKTTSIPVGSYETIRDDFQRLSKHSKQQIVLRKTTL